jgi:hypothetical protein
VHVRYLILRKHPSTDKALELNRLFVEYQKLFGETQKLGKEILRQLTESRARYYRADPSETAVSGVICPLESRLVPRG